MSFTDVGSTIDVTEMSFASGGSTVDVTKSCKACANAILEESEERTINAAIASVSGDVSSVEPVRSVGGKI